MLPRTDPETRAEVRATENLKGRGQFLTRRRVERHRLRERSVSG